MELSHCLHSVLQCPHHPPCSVQYTWLIPVYRQGNQGSRDHITVSDVLERWLEDKAFLQSQRSMEHGFLPEAAELGFQQKLLSGLQLLSVLLLGAPHTFPWACP